MIVDCPHCKRSTFVGTAEAAGPHSAVTCQSCGNTFAPSEVVQKAAYAATQVTQDLVVGPGDPHEAHTAIASVDDLQAQLRRSQLLEQELFDAPEPVSPLTPGNLSRLEGDEPPPADLAAKPDEPSPFAQGTLEFMPPPSEVPAPREVPPPPPGPRAPGQAVPVTEVPQPPAPELRPGEDETKLTFKNLSGQPAPVPEPTHITESERRSIGQPRRGVVVMAFAVGLVLACGALYFLMNMRDMVPPSEPAEVPGPELAPSPQAAPAPVPSVPAPSVAPPTNKKVSLPAPHAPSKRGKKAPPRAGKNRKRRPR